MYVCLCVDLQFIQVTHRVVIKFDRLRTKVTRTVHCFFKVQSYHRNWAIENAQCIYVDTYLYALSYETIKTWGSRLEHWAAHHFKGWWQQLLTYLRRLWGMADYRKPHHKVIYEDKYKPLINKAWVLVNIGIYFNTKLASGAVGFYIPHQFFLFPRSHWLSISMATSHAVITTYHTRRLLLDQRKFFPYLSMNDVLIVLAWWLGMHIYFLNVLALWLCIFIYLLHVLKWWVLR